MPWIIAHKTLWYIDHEIATPIAAPKLIPVDFVVDIYISFIIQLVLNYYYVSPHLVFDFFFHFQK